MIWFTSDTHFDHDRVCEYCKRPWADVEEMNEALIANWNAAVRPGDVVYHLGDFAFRRHRYFAERLNGQIVLIEGTHDKMSAHDKKAFTLVGPLHVIKQEPPIVLCHYAMRVWPMSHYGAWHLFGHSHGHLEPQGKSFDVGVDAWGFRPVSLDEVSQKMEGLAAVGGVDRRYEDGRRS